MNEATHNALAKLLSRGEIGVQIAAYLNGELVLDESTGSESVDGSPVDSSTLFFVASAGKVSTAALLHRQVERGLLDYDQPIASIWPEFARSGKGGMTVRDALTHRVGLSELPDDATPELLDDWEWMTDRLSRMAPSADPAKHDEYHARTWGYVVGEIARRSDPTGRTFEELVYREVHQPLGVEEMFHRVPSRLREHVAPVKGEIFSGEPIVHAVDESHPFNDPEVRGRIDPNGGWMTARSGARLWALYAGRGAVGGTRLLEPQHVESFLAPRSSSFPAGWMAGQRAVIGQGGLMLGSAAPEVQRELGFVGSRVLWHPGAGGALGFADLGANLAVMICHNRLFDERLEPEHPFATLVRAIYSDLGLDPNPGS